MSEENRFHRSGNNIWEYKPGRGWVFKKTGAFVAPTLGKKPPPLTGKNCPPWARKMRGKPCFYCGDPSDTVDHLIPKSRGGPAGQHNCVPCCSVCNGKKGSMTYDEFITAIKEGRVVLGGKQAFGSPPVA